MLLALKTRDLVATNFRSGTIRCDWWMLNDLPNVRVKEAHGDEQQKKRAPNSAWLLESPAKDFEIKFIHLALPCCVTSSGTSFLRTTSKFQICLQPKVYFISDGEMSGNRVCWVWQCVVQEGSHYLFIVVTHNHSSEMKKGWNRQIFIFVFFILMLGKEKEAFVAS